MRTVWTYEGKYKADPQAAYAEIQTLETITPQNVVNLARNTDSVIHNDFEWNDEIAGEKYRVIQAGNMIRSFVLIRDEEPTQPEENNEIVFSGEEPHPVVKLRALHSTSKTHEYAPCELFIENKDEYQILLGKAIAELEAFKRRYAMIAELEDVFNAINNL